MNLFKNIFSHTSIKCKNSNKLTAGTYSLSNVSKMSLVSAATDLSLLRGSFLEAISSKPK